MFQTLTPRLAALFQSYSDDHRNHTNQAIHVVAVPAIAWSVIALLWCVPPLITVLQHGIWAAVAMFAAWCWYNRQSRALGLGMLAFFFVSSCLCRLIEQRWGIGALWPTALAVFALAWVAQFIGHHIEGRRPSFLTDLVYLLVGPVWVLAKAYRNLGLRY
jgi:uncharacterized membrane protein YGL010W